MNPAAQIAFDDDGQPVLSLSFDYAAAYGASAPAGRNAAEDALDALKSGLLIVLKDGHADAALVRCAALARLCDLFASDAEAAAAVKVNRSTMMRAVRRLRSEIVKAAQQEKFAFHAMKSGVSIPPS